MRRAVLAGKAAADEIVFRRPSASLTRRWASHPTNDWRGVALLAARVEPDTT